MIELLAPAANLQSGIAAIDAGADAIYIGGPAFGAREKAGNSIEDIQTLAKYAHLFGVKVYMTMNTILYEQELLPAQQQVWQAWQGGIDALIVQDMAMLEMKLPPIPLHASTQTFNLTANRVKFLQQAGFERVVLERAATLEEMRTIRAVTNVELEAFVHGAVCVCYSGQCYLSQALCNRSGNRGACAQPCRSDWNLTCDDKLTVRNQALLSVSDINLSDNLAQLIDAGITSLKIEGRLKDTDYVVNNTAYYNGKLNQMGVKRTSQGKSTPMFEPNPDKSFSRRFTTFMFNERHPTYTLLNTGGGEYMGRVTELAANWFKLDRQVQINNGDGLCFASTGTNVNSVEGDRVYPNKMDGIVKGMDIFRNLDRNFRPTTLRKIDARITFADSCVMATDENGAQASIDYNCNQQAQNIDKALENITKAMCKSGNTIFNITDIDVQATPFLPISQLNELRRELLEKLTQVRAQSYKRELRKGTTRYPDLSSVTLDYRANVANSMARAFYQKCGARDVGTAFELDSTPKEQIVLLRTRHCIRREQGMCLKDSSTTDRSEWYIENNGRRFRLRFDCNNCEMMVLNIG